MPRHDRKHPTTPTTAGPGAAAGSVIARGMTVDGNCTAAGRLRIEGRVTGSVRAGALEIAAGGSVDGDVASPETQGGDQGGILVEGTVGGAVRALRVEVRKTGTVHGGIEARDASVDGHVAGGILARQRLALGAGGVVEGDIRARRVALAEGGLVNGSIHMGDRAFQQDSATSDVPNP